MRGTPVDPFGRLRSRRMERELPGRYRDMISGAFATQDIDSIVKLAEVPDQIRGYESIKEANVERVRARAAELVAG